jgi:hypothetical protein
MAWSGKPAPFAEGLIGGHQHHCVVQRNASTSSGS